MAVVLARGQPLRGRLTHFVMSHELAWDLLMGFFTVIYVVLAFQEDSARGPITFAIWSLAGAFLLEFGSRCFDSPDRLGYLRSHWLDLITAIPVPGIPGLRIIRLLRLLRFMKVGVLVRRLFLGRGWDYGGLIWPTLFIFWIASAFALWLLEHDVPGSSISSFPEAMTAAFLTAATLGFGKHSLPVTQDGQIVAAIIVFIALGLWGFASSNLTRIWLKGSADQGSHESELIRRELEAIAEQVRHLSEILVQRGNSDVVPQVGGPTIESNGSEYVLR
jgi:voltage-gated potassium channel